jgi:hypothetical protein
MMLLVTRFVNLYCHNGLTMFFSKIPVYYFDVINLRVRTCVELFP